MTDVHPTEIRGFDLCRIKEENAKSEILVDKSYFFLMVGFNLFFQNFWIPAEMKNSKNIDDIICNEEVNSIWKSFYNGHPDLPFYNSKLSWILLYSLNCFFNLVNKILILSFFSGTIPIGSNL